MHELGVVVHIIKTIEDVAKEENLTKVSKVVLEVGEVSTVLPDLLHSCWDWMCRSSRCGRRRSTAGCMSWTR